jgi:hypothetical protein
MDIQACVNLHGSLSPEGKWSKRDADHSPSCTADIKIAINSTPLYFITVFQIKHRDNSIN